MATNAPNKRRIYIVGGKGKNVPPWISAAFEWEQFEQDRAKTRTLEPSNPPDAIVVLSSWVGHEHFYGARDLSERLSVPLIVSAGGWSGSIKAASELGVDWFINDLDRARRGETLSEEEAESYDEFIDNAWREAYQREWKAREALEKRYSKDRSKLDHAQRELDRLQQKETAAQRVIAEIRAAAAAQRTALEEARAEADRRAQEIQDRSERVAQALMKHIESLQELFLATDDSHAAILRCSTNVGIARQLAGQNLDALRAALTIAEDGMATITEDMQEEGTNPVPASNADSES